MTTQSTETESKARIARHRAKAVAHGIQRVRVTVPACDAWIIKAIASILRTGGKNAQKVRKAVTSMTSMKPAKTGAELVDFLRSSPLAAMI